MQFLLAHKPRFSAGSVTWAIGSIALVMVAWLYWCILFNQLRIEWGANEQYAYGWFVPILAVGLLWQRWGDRPQNTGYEGRGGWLMAACFIGLLCALLPLRVLEEANSGWRAPQWAHAIVLAVLCIWFLCRTGGPAWAWHFYPPILFLLISVPWPTQLEVPIVQRLMQKVAAITVGVIHLLGIPGVQHGNLIEVGTGVVSVDGACSGVRSLQTSLMTALLLGELFRLQLWRRMTLIALGFGLAFVANVARTSLLTWGAATRGMGYMEQTLHDPAGLAVVVVVLGGIFISAMGFHKAETLKNQAAELAASDQKIEVPTSDLRPVTGGTINPLHFQFSKFQFLGIFAWLVFTEAATAYWFHVGDQRAVENLVWSVNWPTNAAGYAERGLTKAEQAMLRCDSAKEASWLADAGDSWSMIALRWNPENPNAFLGHQHTPDVCFVGAGWLLRREPEPMRLKVNGLELPFRRYVFEVEGKTAYVFLSFWDERSPGGRQELPLAYGFIRRVKAAWEGERNHGFKKLEISIIGPANEEESVAVLRDGLQKLIEVER